MTVIRPNSIAGINSITAQGNSISIFKSDGSSGLELTGATINSSTGISTFNTLSVSNGAVISGVSTISSLNVTGTTTVGLGTTGSPSISPTGDSNTGVFFPSADTIAFAEGGIEAARFDSSGRLLVGTSSSSAEAKFIVQGGATAFGGAMNIQRSVTTASDGSTIGFIYFTNSSNNVGATVIAEGDGTWSAGTSHPTRLAFSVTADGASSPTERMRIQADGLIRTLSATTSLEVRTQTNQGGTAVFQVANAVTNMTSGGALVFKIMADGDAENANNSYTGISDIKLKENIVEASSQWDDIKALKVRNYNFKGETGFSTHRQIGLIAQEVEQVSPGLVGESSDKDPEGNDLGTVTKSVNYSVLYMKAVKALQEAMERIETLEQRLTDAGIA